MQPNPHGKRWSKSCQTQDAFHGDGDDASFRMQRLYMWQNVHITQQMHMHAITIVHSLSELLVKLIFVRESGANGQSHCDGESARRGSG